MNETTIDYKLIIKIDFFGGFDLPNAENNNNDENLLFPPQANDDEYLNLGFYSNPDWDQNLESYLSELA